MSLDLTLVIDEYGRINGPISSYNRLNFRTAWMREFESVLQAIVIPLPEGMDWFEEDEDSGLIFVDRWDTPLTYVVAHQFAPLLRAEADRTNDHWGMAVAAFVEALPPSTRIVLYWY
jgi:hypothetical protein